MILLKTQKISNLSMTFRTKQIPYKYGQESTTFSTQKCFSIKAKKSMNVSTSLYCPFEISGRTKFSEGQSKACEQPRLQGESVQNC